MDCLPKENSPSILPDSRVVAIGRISTSSSGMLSTNDKDKENIICASATNEVTCFGDSSCLNICVERILRWVYLGYFEIIPVEHLTFAQSYRVFF